MAALGERLGSDRLLKANTVTRRPHSLFRQGCLRYDRILNRPEQRLRPLMQRFAERLLQQPTFNKVFGFI